MSAHTTQGRNRPQLTGESSLIASSPTAPSRPPLLSTRVRTRHSRLLFAFVLSVLALPLVQCEHSSCKRWPLHLPARCTEAGEHTSVHAQSISGRRRGAAAVLTAQTGPPPPPPAALMSGRRTIGAARFYSGGSASSGGCSAGSVHGRAAARGSCQISSQAGPARWRAAARLSSRSQRLSAAAIGYLHPARPTPPTTGTRRPRKT